MRRVESYAALAPLLSAQLRRGVVTNCFLSPADYQREIDAGLFYEEGDGFLLLLRQRAGYRLLNFYLHPGAKLCLPGQTLPLVTELACREKDQDAMRRAQDALCALGFAECFRRLRRTRAAVPVQNTAETPSEASFEAVRAFLLAQFDPLTGCIPPEEELRQRSVPDRCCAFRMRTAFLACCTTRRAGAVRDPPSGRPCGLPGAWIRRAAAGHAGSEDRRAEMRRLGAGGERPCRAFL